MKRYILLIFFSLLLISIVSATTYTHYKAFTVTSDVTTNIRTGVQIIPTQTAIITGIYKNDSSIGGEEAFLEDANRNILARGVFVGNYSAIPPTAITPGTKYFITMNATATWKVGKTTASFNFSATPVPLNNSAGQIVANITGVIDNGNNFIQNHTSERIYGIWGIESTSDTVIVDLLTPASSSTILTTPVLFNASVTGSSVNVTNATLLLYNSTGIYNRTTIPLVANGTTNYSVFNVSITRADSYTWNVLGCGVNTTGRTICQLDGTNNTFNWGYNVTSQQYTTPVVESTANTFYLNLTLNENVDITSATLYYNKTGYSASINVINSTRTSLNAQATAPDVSSTMNVSFYWNITFNSGAMISTSPLNQSVVSITLDNCTTNTVLLANYTLYDEDNQTKLGANTTIKVLVNLSNYQNNRQVALLNKSFSVNPAQVCITTDILNTTRLRLDSEIQYNGGGTYTTEYYYQQNVSTNSSTIPYNIALYNLLSSRAQEFLITYKDSNFIPIAGVLIEITRQYIPLASFLTVEIGKTDVDGKTVGHLVLNDEIYTIYVKKEGVLLATYNNIRPVCQNIITEECTINLNEPSSTTNPDSYTSYAGITYTPSYNQTSRIFSFLFTVNDASTKTISINMTKYDAYLNTTLCTSSLTASSGTATCNIPSTFNNTALVRVYGDSTLLGSYTFRVSPVNQGAPYNKTRFILAFIIILTLPLLAVASASMTLLFFMIGLILSSYLGLIDFGGFGGWTALIWFFVGGVILLIRIAKSGGTE